MKIENLYKYAAKTNFKEWDDRHASMVVAALGDYVEMLHRDDDTTVIGTILGEKVSGNNKRYLGRCAKCKTEINSSFDFCPHCGRPILWETAIKSMSTTKRHTRKETQNAR